MNPHKTIIFSGPTLSSDLIQQKIDAIVLGPVSQGDVLDAYLKYHPTHMAIIDGYYENVPAVWHKEILYVMSQGVHVYGAGSMGALRAAELESFGMIGIGKIFDLYHSNTLEDDDEVAVLHGPAELDFPGLTEAMVNIRITLEHAVHKNVINAEIAEALTAFSKSLFYKDRSFSAILEYLPYITAPTNVRDISNWLQDNFVNQKKIDALELISELQKLETMDILPKEAKYQFYETSFFKNLLIEVSEKS